MARNERVHAAWVERFRRRTGEIYPERVDEKPSEPPKDDLYPRYAKNAIASALFIITFVPGLRYPISRIEVARYSPISTWGTNFMYELGLRNEVRETLRHMEQGWTHILDEQLQKLMNAAIPPGGPAAESGMMDHLNLSWLLNTLDSIAAPQAATQLTEETMTCRYLPDQHYAEWAAERSSLADILAIHRFRGCPCMVCDEGEHKSRFGLALQCWTSSLSSDQGEAPTLATVVDRDAHNVAGNAYAPTSGPCPHGLRSSPSPSLLRTSQFIVLDFSKDGQTTNIDFQGAHTVDFRVRDLKSDAEKKIPYILVGISSVYRYGGGQWDTFVRTQRLGGESRWQLFSGPTGKWSATEPSNAAPGNYDVKFLVFESLDSWRDPNRARPWRIDSC